MPDKVKAEELTLAHIKRETVLALHGGDDDKGDDNDDEGGDDDDEDNNNGYQN